MDSRHYRQYSSSSRSKHGRTVYYRNQNNSNRNSKLSTDHRELKTQTTWEAPTRSEEHTSELKRIKEEIEQAQIDFGPSSPEASKLMVKYAQRYFDAKDYGKAQKLAEEIIKLNKVSNLDGISISQVEKLRADSIQKQSLVASQAGKHGSASNALYRPLSPSRKPSSSLTSRSFYQPWGGSASRSSSRNRYSHLPLLKSGTISNQGSGVTYIDYSKKPSTSASNSPILIHPSFPASTTSISRRVRSGYGYGQRSFSPSGYPWPSPSFLSGANLDSLNGKFEQYKGR